MTSIELNRNVVEKIVGKRLNDSELKEKISMFGTPVDNLTKEAITIDVTPNRPDLLGDQGFGRALAAFLGTKKGLKQYKVFDSKEQVIIDGAVSDVRPHTACAIVKGLKFDDTKIKEIIKVQEKLHITYGRNRNRCAIGVYPLERISFPVTYTAKKPDEIKFGPLGGNKVMTGSQILESHPAGKEFRHLLHGKGVYPIFVDSHGKILSMPPIINSHDIGKVVPGTNDVFVECTGFDIEILKKCLNIIVTALADMGGQVYSVLIKHRNKTLRTPDLSPEKLKIDVDYINKRLGLNLKEKDVVSLLSKMGIGYSKKHALVPAYRTDVLHQIDLVEDIAIAYGYDNFKEEIPKVSTIAKEDDFERFKSKIANIVVGMGLDEINSTNIIQDKVQTGNMLLDFKPIMLFNSLNAEYNSLRGLILPSLLSTLGQNKNSLYPQNIFEIGTIFKKDKNNKSETGIIENSRLAVGLCHNNANFTEIRQKFDRIMKLLDIGNVVKDASHPSFIPGRTARISVDGVDVAYLGELNPGVISNFDIEMPISAFELNLTDLFEVYNKD